MIKVIKDDGTYDRWVCETKGDSKSWPFQRGMILQPIGFPGAPTLGSEIFAQESETRREWQARETGVMPCNARRILTPPNIPQWILTSPDHRLTGSDPIILRTPKPSKHPQAPGLALLMVPPIQECEAGWCFRIRLPFSTIPVIDWCWLSCSSSFQVGGTLQEIHFFKAHCVPPAFSHEENSCLTVSHPAWIVFRAVRSSPSAAGVFQSAASTP